MGIISNLPKYNATGKHDIKMLKLGICLDLGGVYQVVVRTAKMKSQQAKSVHLQLKASRKWVHQ